VAQQVEILQVEIDTPGPWYIGPFRVPDSFRSQPFRGSVIPIANDWEEMKRPPQFLLLSELVIKVIEKNIFVKRYFSHFIYRIAV
jgi:hypothetical protein